MSCFSRSSFISFLLCLLLWILSAAILPRGAVQLAAHVSPSSDIFQFEKEIHDYWEQDEDLWWTAMADYLRKNRLTQQQWREKFVDFYDSFREKEQSRRLDFEKKHWGEFVRRRKNMQQTALALSRTSPVSTLSFIVHDVTNSGPRMLDRFEKDLDAFRKAFHNYVEKQKELNKDIEAEIRKSRRMNVVPGPDGYVRLEFDPKSYARIDLAGMPRYQGSELRMEALIEDCLVDFAVLGFVAILLFSISYVAFLRYDVR
jgi:hypothetical protein